MSNEKVKRTFFCPYCNEKLSFLDGTIVKMEGVLACETFSVRTQFFFPARLGQYGAIIAGNVQVREGAKVEFLCPAPGCRANFTAGYNHDLAEIRMVDESNREYVVVFNKIYGRRATFLVDRADKKLVDSYGEHADSYVETFERPLNYFGAV
jgi:transcription elongation factor Elf1